MYVKEEYRGKGYSKILNDAIIAEARKRFLKYHNKEKPELPGCKERFNFTFIRYVISYNKKKRPEVKKILSEYFDNKILIFKKQKALNNWLKKFIQNENILKKLV